VDFFWKHLGVVGEADGRSKYSGDELWQERIRQGRITDTGLLIVRWDWATAMRPAALCERIEHEFQRARQLRAAGIFPRVQTHCAARKVGFGA
jgi:hypothetical protein